MDTEKRPTFFQKHPVIKDICSLVSFVACVILGTLILNTFVFRSYSVVGHSMENTLQNDDRVIVNRLAVSFSHFTGQEYVPDRGQIIVFANGSATGELTCSAPKNVADQYIIKRVIAFPGERVVLKNGVMTIYNDEHPEGFVYDETWRDGNGNGPKEYSSGETDVTVPAGELFVSGDNREGSFSYDSRNGLGMIPYCRIVGPVAMRLFPLDKFTLF